MKGQWERAVLCGIGGTILCTTMSMCSHAQATAEQKPIMAEQAFKNVQVLRGMPVNEFMEEMGFFSAALTANCITCHGGESAGSWENYALDTDLKRTTRKMVVMMNLINQTYFGGKREVTCYSCHRGDDKPRVTPTIADVYNPPPPPPEPDTLLPPAADQPSVEQILDRYIDAIGGEQKLNALKSYAAKGTAAGYAESDYPAEVFAKAPNQLTSIVHTASGDRSTVFDGTVGWVAVPAEDKPLPLLSLNGDDLDGIKFDATLAFPLSIKQALTQWRVELPTRINDKDVIAVQGTINGRTPVNLYFDKQTGLLVRQVRYSETRIGLYSTQVDYSDYRDVAGVKIPFSYTVSWLDGMTTFQFTAVQPNISIDASKFGEPARPTAPAKPAAR